MLSCSVVFLVVSATLARACSVKLDIDPWTSTIRDESMDHAETRNKVCAYGVNREGKNVFSCVNGVRGDDETIEFGDGGLSKSSPVYLEIQGHDELWLDTITTWFDECNCDRDYGTPNWKGWCMSTNPNDDDNFSSSDVPEGECYRTLRLNTNGSVDGLQSSYALSIPGVLEGFQQAQASVARAFGRWGRRLDVTDVTNGAASSTWAEFEALPENAWVELPGQQRRLQLETNKPPLTTRLAALEEGLQ